jgi:hypothetical protein
VSAARVADCMAAAAPPARVKNCRRFVIKGEAALIYC